MDDRDALALAARQGGVISRAQALDLGFTRGRIDYRVERGTWGLAYRSTYRLLPALDELDLLRGAQVAMPAAVVSHASAGRLLSLDGVPASTPTLSVTADHAHEFEGVLVRRTVVGFPASHLARREGLFVSSPARTVVDLGGHMQAEPWERLAQSTVVSGRCSTRDIARVAELVCGRGRPGSTVVKEFLSDEAASLSALERKALDLFAPLRPTSQHPAPWNPNLRLDLAFPDARLGIELDSRRWHSDGDHFTKDRRRDRHAAANGWLIVRMTWDDVVRHPDETLRDVIETIDQRTPV